MIYEIDLYLATYSKVAKKILAHFLVLALAVLVVSRAILCVTSSPKFKLELKRSNDLHLQKYSKVAEIFLAYFLVLALAVLGVSRAIL